MSFHPSAHKFVKPSPQCILDTSNTVYLALFQTPDVQRFAGQVMDLEERDYMIAEMDEKPAAFQSKTFHHKSVGKKKLTFLVI